MKYYYLKDSLEDKKIGIYPQNQDILYQDKIDWDDIISQGVIGKIEWNPITLIPIYHPKSILTDFLSLNFGSGLFLLITNKFLDIISKFEIGSFQSWRLKVQHKGQIIEYYHLFHSVNPVNDGLILYDQCDFEIGRIGDWKKIHGRLKISVNSSKDFKKINQELRSRNTREMIITNKLVLDFRTIDLDLFRIYYPDYGGFIVSENLKLAIEYEGLTGVRFEPLEVDNKLEVLYE